jgi:hypothetical protein
MIFLPNHRQTPSLSAQIRASGRRVAHRQKRISDDTAILSQKIKRQLAAPPNLLLASGIGFIIGEITYRPQVKSGQPDNKSTTTRSPLTIALSLISSIRTLYTALPLVWLMKAAKPKPPKPKTAHHLPASRQPWNG